MTSNSIIQPLHNYNSFAKDYCDWSNLCANKSDHGFHYGLVRLLGDKFAEIEQNWYRGQRKTPLLTHQSERMQRFWNVMKYCLSGNPSYNNRVEEISARIELCLVHSAQADVIRRFCRDDETLFKMTFYACNTENACICLYKALGIEGYSFQDFMAYASILTERFLKKKPFLSKPEYLSNVRMAALFVVYKLSEDRPCYGKDLVDIVRRELSPSQANSPFVNLAMLNALEKRFLETLEYEVKVSAGETLAFRLQVPFVKLRASEKPQNHPKSATVSGTPADSQPTKLQHQSSDVA